MNKLMLVLSLQLLCLSACFAQNTPNNPCTPKPSPSPWPSTNCGDNINQRNSDKALLNTCLGQWSSINSKGSIQKSASLSNCSTEFSTYMNDVTTTVNCLKNLK